MFNKELKKLVKEQEVRIKQLEEKLKELTWVVPEEKPKETKAEKEERERKERIDAAYQELFNYNETIAAKGVSQWK